MKQGLYEKWQGGDMYRQSPIFLPITKVFRAYSALYLGGTPSQETSTSPSCCQLLENRLCMKYSPSLIKFKVENCIILQQLGVNIEFY